MPRDFFLDMGGFDNAYRNGYEDVDFCLRARQRGRKVYYCAQSVIYHYGQSSPGRTDNDAANAAYFDRKWKGQIRSDLLDYLAKDAKLLPASGGRQPPVKGKKTVRGKKQGANAPRSPADVHFGRAALTQMERVRVLREAYAAHPERFVRQAPVPPALPGPAWINKPAEVPSPQ